MEVVSITNNMTTRADVKPSMTKNVDIMLKAQNDTFKSGDMVNRNSRMY